MSLTQLIKTIHNICKVWGSNPNTTKKYHLFFFVKKKKNHLYFNKLSVLFFFFLLHLNNYHLPRYISFGYPFKRRYISFGYFLVVNFLLSSIFLEKTKNWICYIFLITKYLIFNLIIIVIEYIFF